MRCPTAADACPADGDGDGFNRDPRGHRPRRAPLKSRGWGMYQLCRPPPAAPGEHVHTPLADEVLIRSWAGSVTAASVLLAHANSPLGPSRTRNGHVLALLDQEETFLRALHQFLPGSWSSPVPCCAGAGALGQAGAGQPPPPTPPGTSVWLILLILLLFFPPSPV